MIYKNFSNYDIDIENITIRSIKKHRYLAIRKVNNGYLACYVVDDKGNVYYRWHQVIFCAINGITKDEWPVDDNGRRYEIDHIIPLKNGGENSINNLRLVSKKENSNNELTKINLSIAVKERFKEDAERNKLSTKLKEYFAQNPDIIKKYSEANRGCNNPNYGKKWNEEQKKHLSEIFSGKYLNEKSVRSKKVLQYDLEGNLIKEWPSTCECQRQGYSQSGVSECCRGGRYRNGRWCKSNTYKGYIWKYASI